jgi:hypothetical protein
MVKTIRFRSIMIAATVASTSMAAFLLWAFAQAGTLGMYRWGYRMPVLALAALGVVPLILVVAVRIVNAKASKVPFIAGSFVVVLSMLSFLTAAGVSMYIFSNAYGTDVAGGKPVTVDPAQGLPVRVASDGTPALRVALSSDAHYGRKESDAAARSAILRLSQAENEAGRLDAFFNLGDIVEMGMEADDWREALESIQRDAPTLPFASLLGNHDALIGGSARWRTAFAAGTDPRSTPAEALSASSWRLDAGPAHFIALDLLWGPEGFGPREKAWLKKQLAEIPPDDLVVVLSHCFFYSSGYVDEGTGKPWYDHSEMLREVAPLIAGKADLVVSGHNHYMEWIEADGTAWAVVGAMGGKPDPVPSYKSPGSVWLSQGVFGRLVLELRQGTLVCEFQDHTGRPLFATVITK